MKFTKRLNTIFSELEQCKKFADVGCDHGYCTEYMLKNNLCKSAVISDISADSLKKAQILLADYAKDGILQSICCNGLEKVPADCDFVLIAGMGGEEIINILENGFLPEKLLLQPMKNTPKVREYLISNGYEIIADYTFNDEKFYDIIKAKRSEITSEYDPRELEFGRDNLNNPSHDFILKIESEIAKKENYLTAKMGSDARDLLLESLCTLKEIYNEVTRNL